MEEELNLDVIETNAEEKLKVRNRFQQLSDKVVSASQERDEALAKAQAEAEAKSQAERERDFYKDFSVNVPRYPVAAQYQEQILEKVKAGYATEDAIVSVLNKEGKLSAPVEKPIVDRIEGGSATTVLPGDKTLEQMTTAEKFEALKEADQAGELTQLLRGR